MFIPWQSFPCEWGYLRPWELKELDFIEDEPLDLTRKKGGIGYVSRDILRSPVARVLVDRFVSIYD